MLDGRYWTGNELADSTGLRRADVAGRLAPLVARGLVDRLKPGRSTYFALTGPSAAASVTACAARVPGHTAVSPAAERRLPTGASVELRAGRTCYDHLAGQLGVTITRLLIASAVITPEFGLGDVAPLAPLHLELPGRPARPAVRPCVDWTERLRHAAGALPSALASRMIELGWLRRVGPTRAIRLTQAGQSGLAELLPGAAAALAARTALA